MKYSKFFRKIAKGEYSRINVWDGLCRNFEEKFGENLSNVMLDNGIDYDQWPEFSGTKVYPVKAPEGWHCEGIESTSALACIFYSNCTDKYRGAYGKARRRLAMWLAIEFFKRGL